MRLSIKYKIFILNLFETSKFLPQFLKLGAPGECLVMNCANGLYEKLHYKHKLTAHFRKSPIPLLNKVGLTTLSLIQILEIIKQTGILMPIQKYAQIGKWNKAEGGVDYYTNAGYLNERVVSILIKLNSQFQGKEDKILKTIMELCFETINVGIMLLDTPNPLCSILFAQKNPALIASILKHHPEYFVSPLIAAYILERKEYTKMLGTFNVFQLEEKKCALKPFLLEIIETSDFADRIKYIMRVSFLSNENSPEEQAVVLGNLSKYVDQIKLDLKTEQYVVNILQTTPYIDIKNIFIIMQCVIYDYLKSLISTNEGVLDLAVLSCLAAIEESLVSITCKPSIPELLQEFFLEDYNMPAFGTIVSIIGDYAKGTYPKVNYPKKLLSSLEPSIVELLREFLLKDYNIPEITAFDTIVSITGDYTKCDDVAA